MKTQLSLVMASFLMVSIGHAGDRDYKPKARNHCDVPSYGSLTDAEKNNLVTSYLKRAKVAHEQNEQGRYSITKKFLFGNRAELIIRNDGRCSFDTSDELKQKYTKDKNNLDAALSAYRRTVGGHFRSDNVEFDKLDRDLASGKKVSDSERPFDLSGNYISCEAQLDRLRGTQLMAVSARDELEEIRFHAVKNLLIQIRANAVSLALNPAADNKSILTDYILPLKLTLDSLRQDVIDTGGMLSDWDKANDEVKKIMNASVKSQLSCELHPKVTTTAPADKPKSKVTIMVPMTPIQFANELEAKRVK